MPHSVPSIWSGANNQMTKGVGCDGCILNINLLLHTYCFVKFKISSSELAYENKILRFKKNKFV